MPYLWLQAGIPPCSIGLELRRINFMDILHASDVTSPRFVYTNTLYICHIAGKCNTLSACILYEISIINMLQMVTAVVTCIGCDLILAVVTFKTICRETSSFRPVHVAFMAEGVEGGCACNGTYVCEVRSLVPANVVYVGAVGSHEQLTCSHPQAYQLQRCM